MATIAECLICAFTAAAQSNTIANFICITVDTFDDNATAYPERATHSFVGIFNQLNGRLKFRLNLVTFFIPDNKSTGWAVARFFDGNSSIYNVLNICA